MKQLPFTGWPESAMENLSGRAYPAMASRLTREFYNADIGVTGLAAGDHLCYTQGTEFVLDSFRVDMGLSAGAKKLLLLGEEVLILPDKKYINLMDLSWGTVEVSFRAECRCSLCDPTGKVYALNYDSAAQPAAPVCGEYWVDTTLWPPVLRQFDPNGRWAAVKDTCVRVEAAGIGRHFAVGDGITVTGSALSGHKTVRARGTDHIVVDGILGQSVTETLTVQRLLPEMDHIAACGGRLWGCRYTQGENRIYCSRLGDCRNWYAYGGGDTDAWQACVGVPGAFTGVAAVGDTPVFFKEKWLLRITGSTPGTFRVSTEPGRGVRAGCEASLALAGEKLYYCSATGIMALSGSGSLRCVLPGDFRQAAGGGIGGSYYVSLRAGEQTQLLVYDTVHDLWHREDDLQAADFTEHQGALYCIAYNRILRLAAAVPDENLPWYLETPPQCLEAPGRLGQVTVCLELEPLSRATLLVSYDGGPWERIAQCGKPGLHTYTAMTRCRACRHYRLRLEGNGGAVIRSIRADAH